MAVFPRRGLHRTAHAMSAANRDERAEGLDLLEATERVFLDTAAPSRLGTVLTNIFLTGTGLSEQSREYGAALGAVLFGYSARMAQGNPPQLEAIRGGIRSALPFDEAGRIDYEMAANHAGHLQLLVERVASWADDQRTFSALFGASQGSWDAFKAVAVYQLHKNLVRNGYPRRKLPPADTLAAYLQLGYLLRAIDEAAGEEPMTRAQYAAS